MARGILDGAYLVLCTTDDVIDRATGVVDRVQEVIATIRGRSVDGDGLRLRDDGRDELNSATREMRVMHSQLYSTAGVLESIMHITSDGREELREVAEELTEVCEWITNIDTRLDAIQTRAKKSYGQLCSYTRRLNRHMGRVASR